MKKPGMEIVLGLGKGKPGSEPDEDESDMDMDSSAKDDAADAIISAVHDKDSAALKDALDTYVRLCAPGSYEGDSEEEA